jgi:RNA polymerase I-specific transcription initiation factor RRN3
VVYVYRPEEFRRLLNCIFSYDWKCEAKVSIAMVNLINHIVTTNSTFLARAFQLYVKSLLPGMTTTLASETAEENLPERRNLIHRALRSILVQVPTGRSVLFPILVEHFPHKRFSRTVQTDYTAQLLHVCTYEPMLQAKVLELIVMKCLEMDVEIVIEDSGDVRIDEQALEDGDLELDDLEFDGIASSNGRYGSNNQKGRGGYSGGPLGRRKQLTDTAPTRIPAEVAEMADKLDSVLLLLVQFCEQQIGDTGASSSAATPRAAGAAVASSGSRDRILQQLLSIFENSIMSIHKFKFVQFVVFFAASLHGPFAKAVAEKLLAISLDDRAASTQRQTAVMYLASYLSRSAFLQVEFVR